jgi:hypothetical protein
MVKSGDGIIRSLGADTLSETRRKGGAPAVKRLAQFLLSSVIVSLMLGAGGRAAVQHLPEEHQAKDPPEHVLSGINVYSTLFTEAVKRMGAPTDFKVKEILAGSPPAGTVSYVWRKNGVRLEAAAHYFEESGKRIESVLYSVEVWGVKPGLGEVGRTGAGLSLEASLEEVKKLYGDRFLKGRTSKGLLYVQLEWGDGTQLNLDFDSRGRITHMQLIANVE